MINLCSSQLILFIILLQKPAEGSTASTGTKQQDPRSFKLIMEYIKALPVSVFFKIFIPISTLKNDQFPLIFFFHEVFIG